MSDEQLDPNKVVVELFTSLLKEYGTTVTDWVKSPIKKLIDDYKYSMKGYLNATLERCSKVKTFLNRDEPVELLKVYVQTTFKCDKTLVHDNQLISGPPYDHNLAILGSAGSGKSMFMRYLFIKLSQQPKKRVPVFIELRRLAGSEAKSFIDFIYTSLVTPGAKTTREQFMSGLEHGLFTLLLDGFDEIDINDRSKIEKEILDLRDRFAKLPIIVSSREDDRFSSWVNFRIHHVRPLAQEQVVDLIRKSKYDEEVKHKFVKSLEEGLYDRHKSFLSNPLLAVMMLITFKEIAHIPDKLHIFYEQAFDALFFKHDATKEAAYRRKMHTDPLSIDDFKNCLACFCILTYMKEIFSFTPSQARDYVSKAIDMSSIETDMNKFLADLLESVCMLQRDGLQIVFTHRSFQEYFTAYFIVNHPAQIGKLIDVLVGRRDGDLVVKLIFDMNKNHLEREWILPKLREIVSLMRSTNDTKELVNMMFDDAFVLFNVKNMKAYGWSYKGHRLKTVIFAQLYELHIFLSDIIHELYANTGQDIIPYIKLSPLGENCFYISDLPDEFLERYKVPLRVKQAKAELCQLLETVTQSVEREEQLVQALCTDPPSRSE